MALPEMVLPGGGLVRVRLSGDTPELYDEIRPAYSLLERSALRDGERPSLEIWRRLDAIDVLARLRPGLRGVFGARGDVWLTRGRVSVGLKPGRVCTDMDGLPSGPDPSRSPEMRRILTPLVALVAVAVAAALFAPGAANAARGGAKPGPGSGSGTVFALKVLTGGDQTPNWGEQVTFDVQTTATQYPSVDLVCTRGGVTLLGATTGFYPGYPWPWTQVMTLSSQTWTSGGGDCTATLSGPTGKRSSSVLATLSFPVAP
jgi:hypothetical protein